MRLLVNLTNESADACEHFERAPATLEAGTLSPLEPGQAL